VDLSSAVTYSEDVLARTVDAEGIMVDLASGTYFGLDEIGNRIWELIGERRIVAEILDAVLAEYDVTREVAERDLLRLLGELEAKGLVKVTPGAS
jgi:Coenzyme PQQ synthesis protein D (PqqD)